jgi:hypothetical protein
MRAGSGPATVPDPSPRYFFFFAAFFFFATDNHPLPW